MGNRQFDRTKQDIGNIVSMEHVNVTIPRQDLATQVYVVGLGFTRDPYMRVGLDNMWINIGENQMHLPSGGPQVLRGTIHLMMPGLGRLLTRLAAIASELEGTSFEYTDEGDQVVVICPWGNRYVAHAYEKFGGDNQLGIPVVEFPVETGTADGIARFYRDILGATASVDDEGNRKVAKIRVGRGQELQYRETGEGIADYDGHHVAIYISDFNTPYQQLAERGLLTRDEQEFEYRFQEIVDPENGDALFTLEHEVRSVTHPIFARPLVNRNPDQIQATYVRGADAFSVSS